MNKDTAWTLFEDTGNIDAYMLYHDLTYEDDLTQLQEDFFHADKDRRAGHTGAKRR